MKEPTIMEIQLELLRLENLMDNGVESEPPPKGLSTLGRSVKCEYGLLKMQLDFMILKNKNT